MEQEARKQLAAMDMKRKALESEGEVIILELKARPEGGGEPMGIDTPLVDAEGYPRGDVDVYRARALRSRLDVIRNDHKALMKEIDQALIKLAEYRDPKKVDDDRVELEKRMAEKPKPKLDPKTGKWVVMNWDGTVAGVAGGDKRHFDSLEQDEMTEEDVAESVEDPSRTTTTTTTIADHDEEEEELVPFARINFVAPESPAAEACMEENDLVLDFGGITHINHNDMTAIGELVPRAASENQELVVQILRDGSKLFLKLKPRPWHGRGLLGCYIVKY